MTVHILHFEYDDATGAVQLQAPQSPVMAHALLGLAAEAYATSRAQHLQKHMNAQNGKPDIIIPTPQIGGKLRAD